jgi:L-ascorbate metabolism protein UlaG (beta-lactamase superfamily)
MAAYPSDLSDQEWRILEPLIPPAKPGGRPRGVEMRSILDGIFYLLRSGCAWRMLQHEYPPSQTEGEMMNQRPFNQVRLTHIGGPTVLIEIGQLHLLTDPTFEPAGYQYVAGSQAVSKTTSPALVASVLDPVDAILLSHDQHGDNLDPAGRASLSRAKQILTTPAGAQRLGGKARGVSTWQTVTLAEANGPGIRVTATPARHGPAEIKLATGDVTGWMLEWEGQHHGALYVSGDTVLFEGLEEVARRSRVAVALLHFGAAHTQRFGTVSLTFTGAEGARFATMLGEATIVPIHYEGWTHLTESRDEIEQAFAAAGLQKRLRFLPLGQSVSIDM